MSECQADDHRSLDRKGQHDCSPQNRTQRLNKHMYGIHRPPTPLCSLWVGEQTVERVLQYCAEYGEVRKTCWATETVTCRDLWMPAANFYVTSWLNAPPPPLIVVFQYYYFYYTEVDAYLHIDIWWMPRSPPHLHNTPPRSPRCLHLPAMRWPWITSCSRAKEKL